jgi:hypothetical protein
MTAAELRVRFRRGQPELSVEDMRASGDDSLIRLAEADRKRSNFGGTRGNDNGWLTVSEVDRAAGIHFSIRGGYQQLLEEATRRRSRAIPMSDVAALMKLGASGPVKHRKPPVDPPYKRDPIRTPLHFDASLSGTPAFLSEYEERIDRAISGGFKTVYRGFSLDRYGGPEMIRYLFGDWRSLIASHTFTKKMAAQLDAGAEFHAALRSTADEISREVVQEIEAVGCQAYMGDQSRRTQIGIRNKEATGMATYLETPMNGRTLSPSSFGYAKTGFLGLIHERVVAPTQAMIVVEVEQQVPPDFSMVEYYIPSHIPPSRIKKLYLGFSNWHDARLYLSAPPEKSDWFEVDIVARDREGRPTEMTVTPVRGEYFGDRTESWRHCGESWSSSGTEDAAFTAAHPIIRDTLAQIRESLG